MSSLAIPPEVADRLGYYVYLYIDPRSDRPFYVGKGQGRRILAHLSAEDQDWIFSKTALSFYPALAK